MRITIDEFEFTLIGKYSIEGHSGNYTVVRIHSSKIASETVVCKFEVYSSFSEFGLFRFNQNFTKGENDYVQETLIHFSLNAFIHAHVDALSTLDRDSKDELTRNVKLVFNDDRALQVSPFQNLNNRIRCGYSYPFNFKQTDFTQTQPADDDTTRVQLIAMRKNTFFKRNTDYTNFTRVHPDQTNEINSEDFEDDPKESLATFSKVLENEFTVGEKQYVMPIKTIFQSYIAAQGEVMRLTLHQKSNGNQYYLYFIQVGLTVLPTPFSNTLSGFNAIRSKKMHYVPCALTPKNATILATGVFSEYIPSGVYICKMFDYPEQCSIRENKRGYCVQKYRYIGSRYDNVFPFTHFSKTASPSRVTQQKLREWRTRPPRVRSQKRGKPRFRPSHTVRRTLRPYQPYVRAPKNSRRAKSQKPVGSPVIEILDDDVSGLTAARRMYGTKLDQLPAELRNAVEVVPNKRSAFRIIEGKSSISASPELAALALDAIERMEKMQ